MRLGRVVRTGSWLWVALFVCACSGGDDAAGPAVGKCEELASTWCSGAMDCLVSVGTLTSANRDANYSTCRNAAIAAVPCKKAVSVGAGYTQCIKDTQEMDCARWSVPVDQLSTVKLPATCDGVILISP